MIRLMIQSFFLLSSVWMVSSSAQSGPVIFRKSPTDFGGALVASARSWTPSEPVEFLDTPFKASARSWSPSSGPLVFPNAGPKTNAGQLAYQREDLLRAGASSRPTPRPAKSILFPPDPLSASSSTRQQSTDFRPSQAIPFDHHTSDGQNSKRESPSSFVPAAPFQQASTSDVIEHVAPAKTPRFISPNVEAVEQQSVQTISITEASAPAEEDHEEIVGAIEELLHKLNELSQKLKDSETERESERDIVRSLAEERAALSADKAKLEAEIAVLTDRAGSLDLRLSNLEETVREWLDPNLLAKDNIGKSNSGQKRGAGVHKCPEGFFSLDETISDSSPCYHINPTANYRKNWQDAGSDCRKLGAKLVEPRSAAELQRLTDYLRDKKTDQLGGGYWTGGINPGLLWLWTGSGRPLSGIADGQWTAPAESRPTVEDNGKCLRLTYDRVLQRYSLQGSDCMRYLYFVCELENPEADSLENNNLPPPLPLQSTTARSIVFPLQTSGTTPKPHVRLLPLLPLQTTTSRSVQTAPSFFTPPPTASPPPPPTPSTSRFPIRTTFPPRVRPVTRSTPRPFTTAPPTPNYVGVLGFKDLASNQTISSSDAEALNLAILSDSF